MKTDGVFDYHAVDVAFDHYNEPISLYAISDVHRNSPACAVDRWRRFLDQARADKRQKMFLLLGDLEDALSTSERRTLLAGGFHDSTLDRWEINYRNDINDLFREIAFMKGKTIGVFGGNHFFRFKDGVTSDQAIAGLLGAPYIGCAGYLILNLKYRRTPYTHDVKIFAHHGIGGGRTAGSSFGRLETAAARFRADIVLMGHDHSRGARRFPVLECVRHQDNYKIQERDVLIARTGSFLKSYEKGKASYAVDGLMSPSTIGALKITITPRRDCNRRNDNTRDDRWVDVEADI